MVAVSWCWFIARLLCGQCRYCSGRSVQCYVFRPVRNTNIFKELTETIGNWCAKPNSVKTDFNLTCSHIFDNLQYHWSVPNSRHPTPQETYVMPILNKPVVFQPYKSFSVNVFLIYAGCVPKVWKLMRNKYISVISENNGSQFSLTHLTLPSPRKVEVNLFRILLKKKKTISSCTHGKKFTVI